MALGQHYHASRVQVGGQCDDWDEDIPHRLIDLNAQLPVGGTVGKH